MEQIISKEELKGLREMEGEVRGLAIKDDFRYILQKEGVKGLNKLEKGLAEMGYQTKYSKIKPMSFYPIQTIVSMLLLMRKFFNYGNEDFQEIGKFEARSPLIVRLFVRYFISLEIAAKAVPNMWRTYFTVGDLKLAELNKKEKYGILKLENFRTHAVHCHTQTGYFSGVLQMIVGNEVSCEETKCPFRGDDYHEYLLKW